MENKTNERVIYLKDLFFCVLYKWRAILITVLVFALLLGGYKAVTSLSNIGIIVETGELGGENIGAAGCADALDLVGSHAHANAGTAAENTQIRVSFGQVFAGFFGIYRIVAACGGIGAHIGNGVAFRGEESDQSLLEGVACMVCGNNNSSFFHIFR